MNAWQTCTDTKDAVPLLRSRGLFLKPVALLHVSVRLPLLKVPGNAISNWEIMEKLKFWIQPEEFVSLKVSKSTLEFIRFDGEVMSKSKLALVLSRLDGRSLKVPGIKEHLKVRAVEAKPDFPSKYDWDSYFRDAKNMNEMKAGERPDTVYIGNIPCAWLTEKNDKPSERLLHKIFEQFGEIKRIDIPMLDPFRSQMNNSISGIKQFTFNKSVIFECYIQYVDHFSFVKCMDALRGMKLLYVKDPKEAFTASIKVDFDKLKHLSDATIQRRAIIRERLEKKESQRLAEEMKKKEEEEKIEREKNLEKLERQKLREQRRKEKELEKLRMSEVEEMNKKIAAEEYLLLMAQRKLESIRLLSELINRVKNSREKELAASAPATKRKHRKEIEEGDDVCSGKKSKDNIVDEESNAEKDLRHKLIQKFKRMQQRDMLKENIKLKSRILDNSELKNNGGTSSIRSLSSASNDDEADVNSRLDDEDLPSRDGYQRYSNRGGYRWNGRMRSDYSHYRNNYNNNYRDDSQPAYGRYGRGGRRPFNNQRYQNSWGREQYQNQLAMPFLDPILLSYSHEYYKYLQKLAREAKRRKRSRSRSSSRSRSQSKSRSRSYSRSYTRSRSRSRSRSHSRSRSRKRNRNHSRSRRSRYRSRSYTRSYSKSYTRSRSHSRRKSKSWSRSQSRASTKNAEAADGENNAARSALRDKKSPDKSVDSCDKEASNGEITKKSKSKERTGSEKSKKSGKNRKKVKKKEK